MASPAGHHAAALIAAFARLGLRHAAVSPGSRNAPLSVALADHPDVADWSHHDERSGGFFALGIGKATGTAAAAVSTSGTAAAQFLPAVVEARHARTPLLVLTADRPPELRDVGAPQAIDQVKLFGDVVKWFHEAAPGGDAPAERVGALASHAWAIAHDAPAGPVHLNVPLREPLLEGARDALLPDVPVTPTVRSETPPDERAVGRIVDLIGGRRTVVVCGSLVEPGAAEAIGRLTSTAGFPLMADPLSGLRTGGSGGDTLVAAADLLVAGGAFDRDPPEAILRFGGLPTSKPIWTWLARHPDVPQVLVDLAGWRDPTATVRLVVRASTVAAAAALESVLRPAPADHLATWRRLDDAAQIVISAALAATPFPNEPAIARTLIAHAVDDAAVFAGSSMPIRDVDAFAAPRAGPLSLYGNRGANGIDGSVSTSLGVAAARRGRVFALVGDVATLHDVGALRTAARLGLDVTVVVVHNDGGGIFHFLPYADGDQLDATTFERHFGTPHATDFVAVGRALGVPSRRVTDHDEFVAAVAEPGPGPRLLELTTDRRSNLELHRELTEQIAELR